MLALFSVGCAATAARPEQRAALLVERGQTDEAVRMLREHLSRHPSDLIARRTLVRVLAVTGNLGAAETEARRLAAQLGASDPVPFIELGHAYEIAHRYEEAIQAYDRASAVAPRDPRGPGEGGLRAARWGELELALPRLEEALRRDPRDARLWHALGIVRLKLGDAAGASLAYRSGLQANPGALENRIGLATLALATDDPEAALAQYDAIIAARPRFADAHLGRSWALVILGRLDDAQAALDMGARLGANPRVVTRQRELVRRLRMRPQIDQKR
jgi:Flp pilus assembly protein TadD